MAKDKDDLVAAIDKTAFNLLRKIGGEDTISAQDSAILTDQVKAFSEVAKWAAARVDLLPKADRSDAKFSLIKGEFHNAGRTPRSRRSAGSTPAEVSPAADLGADTEPDIDSGAEDLF